MAAVGALEDEALRGRDALANVLLCPALKSHRPYRFMALERVNHLALQAEQVHVSGRDFSPVFCTPGEWQIVVIHMYDRAACLLREKTRKGGFSCPAHPIQSKDSSASPLFPYAQDAVDFVLIPC